jgi:cobalt-zinc-cadmium efflux system protein
MATGHVQGSLTGGKLRLAFLLTAIILLVEAVAGVLSHSLALLSDAGHILTDVVALGLAWFAVEQARRPADVSRTYGYHRVGILAAMVNGATLIVIVIAIAVEAARRFGHPEPVQGPLVIVAALIAIAVNAFIGFSLRGSDENLNARAAMLHVVGDLAASIGVVVAGIVIVLGGWVYIDPLLSLGIAALIAWGAVRLVRDTVHILLEGTPRGLDLAEVERAIAATEGVISIHDLHVWTLSPGQLALSSHIVVSEEQLAADTEHMIRRVERELCDRFGIGHTTIQPEACHPCPEDLAHGVGDHNHPHAASARGDGHTHESGGPERPSGW